MARSDYRLCDVCDGKAFYDANIDYDHGDKDDGFRVAERYDAFPWMYGEGRWGANTGRGGKLWIGDTAAEAVARAVIGARG